MEFTQQFTEAAQQAILRKVEADQWEGMPWLAKLVQDHVRRSLTSPVVTDGPVITGEDINVAVSRLENDWSKKSEPVDLCGCPMGACTCQSPSGDAPKERYTPPTIRNNERSHIQGYDWQIAVLSREKNPDDSYMVHFAKLPTQEEFDEHFVNFQRRTHYVYLNEWKGDKWESITTDYVPGWNKEKPKETFSTSEEWPEGKSHRIRFHDQRVGRYNYVYFERKPGGIVLNKYHSAKCFAVVEARPEGV